MAYDAQPLDILPGIFKEASGYAANGRYIDGNNVRFWKGFPERIGGSDSVAEDKCLRPARTAVAWRSASGELLVAFAHARGVQLLRGGFLTEISPDAYYTSALTSGSITGGPYANLETITTPSGGSAVVSFPVSVSPIYIANDNGTLSIALSGVTGTFAVGEVVTATGGATARVRTTTASSPVYVYDDVDAIVTLTGGAGTYVAGETVNASGGGSAYVTVGGTTSISVKQVAGTFTGTLTGATSGAARTISTVENSMTGVLTGTTSGATGTITSSAVLWKGVATGATSGATTTLTSISEFNPVTSGSVTSYGSSTWGSSVWGGVETIYSTVSHATTWTLATWGEDLIGCPRAHRIYSLDTSAHIATPTVNMTVITGAPLTALGIFMSDVNRTLVAYGAHDGTALDPLNIRWCDEEDYTTWTPSASNTAGSIRCEDGSVIVGHIQAKESYLISTDTAVYQFRYIGLPYVFSLEKIATGSTLIGPNAGTEQDGVSYWMGRDGFYFFDGSVNSLPCDVHAYVFGRLNAVQAYKVVCGSIRAYNEVWWFYVSTDETEIDSYVCYNTVERTWSIGTKSRTCWIDSNVVFANPTSSTEDGTILVDEYGTTDNGAPLPYTLSTGDMEVDDGTTFLHARKLIPDYDRISGDHAVTIETRGWPARTPSQKGPYALNETTTDISVRARGRAIRLLFSGSDDFRMGRWRYRVTGHGRKE